MAANHETGKAGENIASEYLKKKGYDVLETNWRKGPLEIDLIARKDNMVVVAEVKTRHTNLFGEPEEFVSRLKQKNLIRAANLYVIEKNIYDEIRFDIISIILQGETNRIHHIEDAFYPTL
jgi:putative endonuclease